MEKHMSRMTEKLQALGVTTVDVSSLVKSAVPAQPQGFSATTPSEDVRQKRAGGF
jgi:hypothetical protein